MKKIVSIVFAVLFASFVQASSVQEQLKAEYGNCYSYWDDNLYGCKPASCTYPDATDAKAWRAQTIVGKVDKKCYVMYYSYIGQKIVGEPDHCFYDPDQLSLLAGYYRSLFAAKSSIKVVDLKDKINNIIYIVCKKSDVQKK